MIKTRIRGLIFGMAILASANLLSAQEGRIIGTVHLADGTKLSGVLISIEGTTRRAFTDMNGSFVLNDIPAGKAVLAASLFGFSTVKEDVVVQTGQTAVVDFVIDVLKEEHEKVVAAARPLLSVSEKEHKIIITPAQIASLPSLGEKDIFRAFQLLPGISGSNETSSGLYVRGGTPDQNLILYDGFTIYHVDHLFGYFSAFNMEALKDAQLSKGGFEAKYGGRISSVMELEGRSGNEKTFQGSGGLSFLSVNGLVEVPLFGKGSLLIAGRRSFQSPLYEKIMDMFTDKPPAVLAGRRAAGRLAQFESQPKSYFYDANAKLTFALSPKDLIAVSLYNGRDDLDNSRTLELPSTISDRLAKLGLQIDSDITDLTNWENTGLSASWTRNWSDSFQSTLRAVYSKYVNHRDRSVDVLIQSTSDSSNFEPRSFRRGSVENNDLKDLGFKFENTFFLGRNHQMEFGAQATSYDISYDYQVESGDEGDALPGKRVLLPRNLIGIMNRKDSGLLLAAYVQDRWTLFDRLSLTPGIRLTSLDRTKALYGEPRFSFSLRLTGRIKFTGAWGKYYQFVNRVTREDVLQGNREFWILSDAQGVPISSATHTMLGLSYETEDILIDVGAYEKDLVGLSEFAPRIVRADAGQDYSRYIYPETGIAKGIEFLLQKKSGNYTGWISYTLSRVDYSSPQLSSRPFPAPQDQTHELKIVNCLSLKKWTFSGTWIYATGRPYTPPLGVDQVEIGRRTVDRVIIGEKNGARLPDYHRLDLSATFDFRAWGLRSKLGLTLFNAYNRKNVWYKEFDIQEHDLVENDIQFMGFVVNMFWDIKF